MRHLATAASIELTASSLLPPILFSVSIAVAVVRVEVPANTRVVLVATVGVVIVIRR